MEYDTKGRKKIRCVDYQMRILGTPGTRFKSIKDWLNQVRNGTLFPYNHLLSDFRGEPLVGRVNHHQMLHEMSLIMHLVGYYWGILTSAERQSHSRPNDPVPELPHLSDLIFFNPADFQAGQWQRHSHIWLLLLNMEE